MNLASRLESLSKAYGADIVAGEHTRMHILRHHSEDALPFYFRLLDMVQVKGKSEGGAIYEIGSKETQPGYVSLLQEYTAARHLLAQKKFEEAIVLLQGMKQQFPQDKATHKLLMRCYRYRDLQELYDLEYNNGIRVMMRK